MTLDKFSNVVPEEGVVDVYTDGACLGNPGPGGWGVLALYKDGRREEYSGNMPDTTNNRMELQAVIEALRMNKAGSIRLYTDSQYVKNGITLWIKTWKRNGWRTSQKTPVKNQDLWQEISDLVEAGEKRDAGGSVRIIEWVWVKGHSGNAGNEGADALATFAARCLLDD